MHKYVVLYSGGLDSTCMLYKLIKEVGSENVVAINVFYGQKHPIERECARYHAKKIWGIEMEDHYMEADLSQVFQWDKTCSLLAHNSEVEVAEGTYEEQQEGHDGPVATYVPFRNGLMLSYATAIAYQLGFDRVALAIHKGDTVAAAYPDCTKAFASYMCQSIQEGTGKKVSLSTPFVGLTKVEVVAEGKQAGMDAELFRHTHSCYKGVKGGCGKCATCLERNEALRQNGIEVE